MSVILRHDQFPHQEDIIYLNHAAVSPWPLCATEAINEFAQQNLHFGSKNYLKWLETEQALRDQIWHQLNTFIAQSLPQILHSSAICTFSPSRSLTSTKCCHWCSSIRRITFRAERVYFQCTNGSERPWAPDSST